MQHSRLCHFLRHYPFVMVALVVLVVLLIVRLKVSKWCNAGPLYFYLNGEDTFVLDKGFPHEWDSFPKDMWPEKYFFRYKCEPSAPVISTNRSFVISLTTIPPRFSYLTGIEDNFKSNDIYVNIPREYKYFPAYEVPRLARAHANIIDHDYGPGSKLIGICNLLDKLTAEVIVYLDEDIGYDLETVRVMVSKVQPGLIVAGNGGFYTESEHPLFSYLTFNQMRMMMDLPRCDIYGDAVMGFSGVAILKSDAKKVCNDPNIVRFRDNPHCFFIDDDWLSYIFRTSGLRMITNPNYIASRDPTKSEMDKWSNRKLYQKSRELCFAYPNYHSNNNNPKQKLIIATALKTSSQSLHALNEYSSIKEIVRTNHLNFVTKFDHRYKMYTSFQGPAHWLKQHILLEFLQTCSPTDILFYTDFDFLFTSNYIPVFKTGSLIMSRGCKFDENMVMVGNFFAKCDKELIEFVSYWQNATQLAKDEGIFNDDQISFNMIRAALKDKLQIEDFFRYDKCDLKLEGMTGVHFPGGGKDERMHTFLKKLANHLEKFEVHYFNVDASEDDEVKKAEFDSIYFD